MKTIKNKAKKAIANMNRGICNVMCKSKCILTQNRGEGYVDTAVKILMAVVIGALVLAGLYALFGETVMPTLTQRIKEMFNYAG